MALTVLFPDIQPVHRLAARFELAGDSAGLEAEWRDFARTAIGHVFADYDFIAPWLEWIAPVRGVEPRIVVTRDEHGRLTSILPLGLRQNLGARQLEWLGGTEADYHGGLFSRELLTALRQGDLTTRFTSAVIDLAGGDVVRFERQPAFLDDLPNPFCTLLQQRHPDDAFHTHIGSDWNAYYGAKRQGNSRRLDKRKLKKMETSGAVEFITATTAKEAGHILDTLFAQKARALGEMGVGNLFAGEEVRNFYRAVASRPYPEGPSHVAALTCNGEIVASNWGLARGSRYYYVMHSFGSGEIARASPGRQLMYRLMQWSIAKGIDTFDFTIGGEAYKDKWCEVTVPLFSTTFARSARGAGAAAALRGTTALKRLVKSTPALWKAAEFARRQLGRNTAPAAAAD